MAPISNEPISTEPIVFELDQRELKAQLKLNGARVWPRWKVFLLMCTCLIPTMVIFWWMKSKLSLLFGSVMAGVLLLYAVVTYFKKTGVPQPWASSVQFLPDVLRHQFSHTETEIKWNLIDRVEETKLAFLFYRLSNSTLIPKRVLDGPTESYRDFFQSRKEQEIDNEPVELFTKHFSAPESSQVFPFAYAADEFKHATRSRFLPVTRGSDNQAVPTGPPGIIRLLLSLILIVLCLLVLLGRPREPVDIPRVAILVTAWLLPIVWVWIMVFWVRWKARRKTLEVPTEPMFLKLGPSGWAVGNENAVTHFDWRDVEGFYRSERYLGLKTINQLINLIPTRIFADSETCEKFLHDALEFHWQRQSSPSPTSAELKPSQNTDNPYQPPTTI